MKHELTSLEDELLFSDNLRSEIMSLVEDDMHQ